jgi:histidine triad (HIT) family protein
MAGLFTRIIRGEIPCHKLAEDDRYFAFLDINPLQRGHALVIPKVEVDKLFDLEPEILGGLLPFAQQVARKIEAVVPCNRVGLLVIGLEVPHAHVHLVPINSIHDMDLGRTRVHMGPEELAELAERIRNA